MSKKYSIRPLAWRLSPELTELRPTFYALRLPAKWKETFSLLAIEAKKPGFSSDKISVPCDGLHRALTALVGDLLLIEKGAWRQENNTAFWILSDVAVPLEGIFEIVIAWARLLWGPSSALDQLSVRDLKWDTLTPNLADWGQAPNGTARPASSHSFRLLPHYIAGQLSREPVTLQIGSAHRELRRCPTAAGAELMTWPPETVTVGKQTARYCVTLRFSTQTVPFQSFPVIHCEVGVRRWKASNAKYASGKTNVYLNTAVPWLPKLHQSHSFQMAPMSWERSEHGAFEVVWDEDSYLIDLLNQLHPHHCFPAAKALFEDSEQYFDASRAQFAGIVHSTRMGSHAIGSGIFPLDLRSIGEQLNDLLNPLDLIWTKEPKALTIPVGFSVPENIFATAVETKKNGLKPNAGDIQQHRRENAPLGIAGELHFEFFFQNKSAGGAFERELHKFFGVHSNSVLLPNGSQLRFRISSLGHLGAALTANNNRDSYQYRVREIEQFLADHGGSSPVHPTLSFIELGDSDFFKRKADPKDAIRAGFAACGRLTQFISQQSEDLPTDQPWPNAEGAILDAMRQLGLNALLPDLGKLGLPDPIQIMALWLVKNCRDSAGKFAGTLPLWLRIDSETGSMDVKALGWSEWLPLRQAQLALANPYQSMSAPTFRPNEVLAFIEDTLRCHINGDTVVFCDAQNSRLNWKWLQDSRLTPDTLAFLENARPESVLSWPNWKGLRILRVRDCEGGEVAQHFSSKGDGVSAPSGVFAFEDAMSLEESSIRVYGSLNPKPVQFASLRLDMSRFEDAVGKNSWNARLLEITTAALQEGDLPQHWAFLAHRLREGSTHSRGHTALPLPLHLAQKLEEYVLPN